MRLKTELHRIIGLCAGLTFLVVGLVALWSVRRFHRVEYVESRGAVLAHVLRRVCVEKLEGPNPVPELTEFFEHLLGPGGEEDLDLVSAVIYDPERRVLINVGATSREHDPGEAHVEKAYSAQDPEAVEVESGEVFDRWSKNGEEIVEFALPLVGDRGERLGVLVFALVRRGARAAFYRTVLLMFVTGAAGTALLWFVLFKMLDRRILQPILVLSRGIEAVRGGDLSARVEIYRHDEIGTLVESFNDLIAVLVERDSLQARLEEANRLEEAHRKLEEAHRQLKAAQEQLIITEKHASLGRLVHGLNHELNNPLSAAQNMLPPLEAALAELRSQIVPPPAGEDGAGEDSASPDSEGADDGATATEATNAPAQEIVGAADPTTFSGSPSSPGGIDSARLREALDDAARAVGVLERSIRRAINIVHDLGAFSKLTTADLEWVELQTVVDEAIAACEPEGIGQRISVSVDLPLVDGKPLALKAFPNLLTQVFVNLLTNSAHAIEDTGRVRIWAKLLGEDRVRIEIDDTGSGIPKENLPKIFEPFFTTKEQGKGSGLGLALCLGIVQKHGGSIGVKKRWRGAHFVIELPRVARLEDRDPFASGSLAVTSTTTVLG
ncbi:MAG: HAMP domain-containing protein [Planctomycetota bacterium]|nr:MAG: HAMP domain-containing protein [Planctomycetota bacterium]